MDLAKLTLRREEEELVIKIHTKEDDKCCKLEWKEKKTEVPPTPTLRLKIEIEELEEDMTQLQIDVGHVKEEPHELTNQL
jgi:tRNA A37 threonylcarbamoyladenosine biosynthesis protein TsaE